MMHVATILFPLLASLLIALMYRLPEKYVKFFARAFGLLSSLLAVNSALHWSEYVFTFSFFEHEFFFDLNYDQTSSVFSLLTAFCGAVIIHFSSFYLHKEKGFARFFSLIFLLIGGMHVLSMADNLFSFFIGWEFLGIASYLLISFYWQRKESVNNAIKVFAIYRIGDLGLMSGMLLMHLTAHADVRFSNLHALASIEGATVLAVMGVLIAAFAKSAQPPFSYWLPKAMEGPTPSSAIFYGALAVHAGALLLIRMSPLWGEVMWPRILIGVVGFAGAVFGAGSARIQTSIKGRLAMASVSQVGLIFIEIAFGYLTFALYHVAVHALYRSVQLIVSPSIVAYFFDYKSKESSNIRLSRLPIEKYLPETIRSTLYVLAMQDFFSDLSENLTIDKFLKGISSLKGKILMAVATAVVFIYFGKNYLLPTVALYCSLLSLREPRNVGFVFVMIGELLLAASVIHNPTFILIFALPWCLLFLTNTVYKFDEFFGLFTKHPARSFILMVVGVVIIGTPPFPSFLLGDIVMADIFEKSLGIAFLAGVCHSINGYVIFRNLAFITMGQYREKPNTQLKSSISLSD